MVGHYRPIAFTWNTIASINEKTDLTSNRRSTDERFAASGYARSLVFGCRNGFAKKSISADSSLMRLRRLSTSSSATDSVFFTF